ncbi:hypothetical protein T492DRAFT_906603 [Pavlovales sp. CCMP2436]|nr:hypothetical protein T492DRAFT_906603 [Pavlovales sp. CCMP2436]
MELEGARPELGSREGDARAALELHGYAVLEALTTGEALGALRAECDLLAAAHAHARQGQRERAAAAKRRRTDAGNEAVKATSESEDEKDVEDPLLDPFELAHVPEADPARVSPLPWLRLRAAAVARARDGLAGGHDGGAGGSSGSSGIGAERAAAGGVWATDGGVLARLVLEQLPLLVEQLCRGGQSALLFGEHYICKQPHSKGEYAWHADADEQLPPGLGVSSAKARVCYISAWLPLDDMSESNGPLILWPRSRPQPPEGCGTHAAAEWLERWTEGAPGTLPASCLAEGAPATLAASCCLARLAGPFALELTHGATQVECVPTPEGTRRAGSEGASGIPPANRAEGALRVPPAGGTVTLSKLRAGDCVLFRSDLYHRSGCNRTDRPRRAYQAQYFLPAAARVLGGRAPLGFAVPPLLL